MTPAILLLLLHLLQASTDGGDDCPSLPQKGLTCYNDYSHNITCIWNSSSVSDGENSACSIYAEMSRYNASCQLRSFDSARPALKKCSLAFKGTFLFISLSQVSMNMSCLPSKRRELFFYKPGCHIKVNPPGKPEVNVTTVYWLTQVQRHFRISVFRSELQWKQKEQQWSDLQSKSIQCKRECEARLEEDRLLKGEAYEARVRVLAHKPIEGTWSDWSPTVSWVSHVGQTRPASGKDVAFLNWSFLGLAVFCVLLLPGAFITIHKSNCSRTYILKKITGPPLPNPAKSAQFKTWLNPHFTSESYQSFLKSVNIVSVEVTSAVDAVVLCKPDVKAMPENDEYKSSRTNFSNFSYSGLFSPAVFPLAAGRPELCVSNRAISVQKEDSNKKQDGDVAKKEQEMVKLLLMGRMNNEAVVISDYKKDDKLQAELHRLHSVDSGMSSNEEVSQDSIEADSMNMTDEGELWKQEKEGNNEGNETKSEVQKLFEGSRSISGKNSIISPYKLVPMAQGENADLLRLHSVDSGMSNYEDVSQETIEEDSINMTEGRNEWTLSKEQKEKDFQKLFGGSEDFFGENSPQGFSGYKPIPIMQAESPELPSMDSGISRIDEENLEDSMEDDDQTTGDTRLWFPPLPPSALTSPLSPQPSDTTKLKLGSALPTLQSNDIFKQIILMSNSVHPPCDGGYRPVRREQSKEWNT